MGKDGKPGIDELVEMLESQGSGSGARFVGKYILWISKSREGEMLPYSNVGYKVYFTIGGLEAALFAKSVEGSAVNLVSAMHRYTPPPQPAPPAPYNHLTIAPGTPVYPIASFPQFPQEKHEFYDKRNYIIKPGEPTDITVGRDASNRVRVMIKEVRPEEREVVEHAREGMMNRMVNKIRGKEDKKDAKKIMIGHLIFFDLYELDKPIYDITYKYRS